MDISTLCLHADKPATADVSCPIHVSTTYRYPPTYNENEARRKGMIDGDAVKMDMHVYSRYSSETTARLEQVLGSLEEGGLAVTYGSGLAAMFAVLHLLQPKHILILKNGYHGSHLTLNSYIRGRDTVVKYLEDGFNLEEYKAGDIIWLESPLNPCGEVQDFESYSARPEGVMLCVDSTFAPPPIQKCLSFGVDVVMHSSTKFLGGHSDLLGGVLMTRDKEVHGKV
jgi:cystathionine gamma-synthase